jgi:predicted Zn-dependent protease with MMP-like domain
MNVRQTPWGPPPDADAIEAMARAALDRLPDAFRRHLGDVILQVEEFAGEDVLAEMGIDDPFALSGLYTGRPVGMKSVEDSGALPDMIQLYRRPILDEWAEGGEALETLVAHILIHEVGHHFGLSDADMHALEDSVGDDGAGEDAAG